jgi:hypothetical protein
MELCAVLVFKQEKDILFRLVEHQGEDIKNFYMGSSRRSIPDSQTWITAIIYRKKLKMYANIHFEGGSFKGLLRYNRTAWVTYFNYRVLVELIGDKKIRMSFFRD